MQLLIVYWRVYVNVAAVGCCAVVASAPTGAFTATTASLAMPQIQSGFVAGQVDTECA